MKNVTFLGNMIVDSSKLIDVYPSLGMLTKIKKETFSVGGSACNTSIDLKSIDNKIDVSVIGRISSDDKGKFILEEFKKHQIDVSKVIVDDKSLTSYTDCMVDNLGRRTFFQFGGANDNLNILDVDVEKLNADLLHVGYLLLLPKFDEEDEEYGTKLARLLSEVRKKNIKTSIDIVSEESDRFKKVVIPSLPHCDYVIVNEIESGKIVDISPRDEEGHISVSNIKKIIDELFKLGVKDTVIIHAPELGAIKRKNGDIKIIPSFVADKERIISSVGAGDAFLAGAIYGLINNLDDIEIVKLGHASAIFNLYSKDSVSGATDINTLKEFIIKGKENKI